MRVMASYGWESLAPFHFPYHAGGTNSKTAVYGLKRLKIVVVCGTVGGKILKQTKRGSILEILTSETIP